MRKAFSALAVVASLSPWRPLAAQNGPAGGTVDGLRIIIIPGDTTYVLALQDGQYT